MNPRAPPVFSAALFATKLQDLAGTSEKIAICSNWVIFNAGHATELVTEWAQHFSKNDIKKKVVLIYLANEILQRQNRPPKLTEEFKKVMPGVINSFKFTEKQSKDKVVRVLRIWDERQVFDRKYMLELFNAIGNSPANPEVSASGPSAEIAQNIPSELKVVMDEVNRLISNNDKKLKVVTGYNGISQSIFDLTPEQIKTKPNENFDQVELEVLEAKQKLMNFSSVFESERESRTKVIQTLKAYSTIQAAHLRTALVNIEEVDKKLKFIEQIESQIANRRAGIHQNISTAMETDTSALGITLDRIVSMEGPL